MAVPKNFPGIMVELDGTTKTVQQWCDERKLSIATVYSRRQRGTWAEAMTPAKSGDKWRAEMRKTAGFR